MVGTSHRTPHPPVLAHAILDHVAADWPEFAEVRAAARAFSQRSRVQQTISAAANEVRVALAAALLAADRNGLAVGPQTVADSEASAELVSRAHRLFDHARAIVFDGAGPLAAQWHLSPAQVETVRRGLAVVVGGLPRDEPAPAAASVPVSPLGRRCRH